ncbi:hypothetical protein GCM10022224_051390 [Nonomuraea antimicrobica]|uniref:Uncharacterized protein n=1 Tax=Nonomuraea antimicrobica TaxID=561173 RepID=A0ABP7C947_9ACTN
MSLLEQRYRSVLRLLPASYRAEREEEMVSAFTEMSGEVPDEVNPRPRWGEIASVLALSVRVRLGGVGATPRAFAWGRAVRLLALLGLAHQSMYATSELIGLAHQFTRGTDHQLTAGQPLSFERLMSIAVLAATVCSAVAFAAIVRGHVRWAKVTALLGAAPMVVYFVVPMVLAGYSGDGPLTEATRLALVLLPLAALLAGFHSDFEPTRGPWTLALAPAAAGLALLGWPGAALALGLRDPEWIYMWLDLGMVVAAWAVGATVVLARRRSASWALALSAAGLLLLAARLPALTNLPAGVEWAAVCVQCALLGTLSAALAATGLGRLPAVRSAPGP